jgi:hypothetical protein
MIPSNSRIGCLSSARRGGAYGIAGVVKGLGILSLRAHGIMDALKAGIENKSNPKVCLCVCMSSTY